jgi:hypothetical protein
MKPTDDAAAAARYTALRDIEIRFFRKEINFAALTEACWDAGSAATLARLWAMYQEHSVYWLLDYMQHELERGAAGLDGP